MGQVSVLRGVVAVDGPSGTGKSTAARRLAIDLRAHYLDTGAMYRAATLGVLRAGADPAQADAVDAVVTGLRIELGTDPGAPTVHLDGEDVAAEIRGRRVTAAVSEVSAVPAVRTRLVAQQRVAIGTALDRVGGIVVEGRDIGTVVATGAGLKVFLTASAEARAGRRAAQDGAADIGEVRRAVDRRDRFDSGRAASPLRPADDAVPVDTTDLDVAAVLVRLRDLVAERGLLAVTTGGP